MAVSNSDIARYYDTHQFIYTFFWSQDALHIGLWYDDTRNLTEAIRNTNKFIMEALDIGSEDTVLDAGCGVGGTSIYIAENAGAKVTGITISETQLRIARKKAAESDATALLRFSEQDFTRTDFKKNTFSKIFGIESICHAHNKLDFLKEAYRIMKPGGKIAVVDGFLTKEELDAEEEKIYTKFIEGWAAPNMATKDQFSAFLSQAGFKNVDYHDMSDNIEKSVKRIYRYSWLTYPFNLIGSKLGLVRENFAARHIKNLFDREIGTYGAFVAEK